MEFWIKTWTLVFFSSLTIFTVLAVCVSIGGFFNILSLFKNLKEQVVKLREANAVSDRDPSQEF